MNQPSTDIPTITDLFGQLAGVGDYQPTAARWDFTAVLTLRGETTPAGTRTRTDTADADITVDRDPTTGRPRIRFTTLAGLLAHHAADRLTGYAPTPHSARGTRVDALFGDLDNATILSGDDITLQLPGGAPLLTRRRNRGNPATGTADTGALWDNEVLPVGTTGRIVIRVTVPAADDPDTQDNLEAELLTITVAALAGLTGTTSGIRLGSHTRTGKGTLTTDRWAARRVDPRTPHGWATLHRPTRAEYLTDLTDLPTHPDPATAVHRAHPTLALPDQVDQRSRDELRLTLAIGVPTGDGHIAAGLLRVGDAPPPSVYQTEPADTGAPEVSTAHRTRPEPTDTDQVAWVPVTGGPGLLRLLKQSARRILAALTDTAPGTNDGQPAEPDEPAPAERAAAILAHWFGGEPHHPTPAAISTDDPPLTGGGPLTRGRVTIDGLFGDAVNGRLFTERVHAGGHSTITLTIRNPDPIIRGLLAHITADLATWSPIPLGGGGHGHITCTAATLTCDTPDTHTSIDLLDPDSTGTISPWHQALLTATGHHPHHRDHP